MHPYAKTNVQLINQLRRENYSNEEIVLVIKTYELTIYLFTSLYQPSGQTQISHGVGTASILASLHTPAELVAAGLLHNVYGAGDFGDGRKAALTNSRRKLVRDSVGSKVEEYLYRFPELRKEFLTLIASPDTIDALNDTDRHVLLIILADQLDLHLDYSRIYQFRDIGRVRNYINLYGNAMVETAEKLGFPALAAELQRVFRETISAEIPQVLLDQFSFTYNRTIVPKSYRKRFVAVIGRRYYRLRSIKKLKTIFDLFMPSRARKNSI